MTQEEKAKRYDELLLKLQKAKVDNNVCDERYCCVIDDIVPELAKSEDERIREELIAFLKENHETGMAEKTWSLSGLERWIAWLEKQGEQILANSTKTCKDEQKHVDKVEPKFKVGDVLNSPSHHLIWIYKDNEHYYACVNMNYVTENVATDGLIKIPSDACPATKEQREQLENAMADAGYAFNFEKKELKKIEKPWSEEDERMLDEIIDFFENGTVKLQHDLSLYASWLKSLKNRVGCEVNCTTTKEWSVEDMSKIQRICKYLDEAKKYYADITEVRECIEWLKFLRPQYIWQPSDEQLEVLLSEVTAWSKGCSKQKVLESLYQDLKKLK